MTAGRLWGAACLGLAGFVAAVLAQHAVVPELSPKDHVISEYANADAGFLMVAGFVAWAASLVAMSMLLLQRRKRAATRAEWWMAAYLGVAGLGALLTAVFPTQAVAAMVPANEPRTTVGRLHDLGSGLLILAVLMACLTSLRALQDAAPFRRATIGLAASAVVTDIVLLAIGDPSPGMRQRILVGVACTWQVLLLGQLKPTRA